MSLQKIILIASISLIVISIVLGYFFVLPKYNELKQQKLDLANLEKAIESKNNYYLSISRISKEMGKKKEEIDKLSSALPSKMPLPVLFNYFENLVEENGLVFDDISSDARGNSLDNKKENVDAGIKKIRLSVSVSGSYEDFKKFLDVLWKSAKLIDINSISFSSPKEGSFNVNLSLTTYFLPENQQMNPPAPEKGMPENF